MVSFQEAENYINEIPRFAGKNSVEDTARLLSMAGCDRLPAKIVHVAGTNGKGSVCSYLAAILKQAGFRVGRFTSPHLQSICERISMDDRQITEEEFDAFIRNNSRNASSIIRTLAHEVVNLKANLDMVMQELSNSGEHGACKVQELRQRLYRSAAQGTVDSQFEWKV